MVTFDLLGRHMYKKKSQGNKALDTHQLFKKCQTLGKINCSYYLFERWKYVYVNEEPILKC